MTDSPDDAGSIRHWRRVRALTAIGLLGWAVLVWGVIWFAAPLNQWRLGRAPAGYWFAAQGAIVAFLVLILLHNAWMERLDRREAARRRAFGESHSPGDAAEPIDSAPRDLTP